MRRELWVGASVTMGVRDGRLLTRLHPFNLPSLLASASISGIVVKSLVSVSRSLGQDMASVARVTGQSRWGRIMKAKTQEYDTPHKTLAK